MKKIEFKYLILNLSEDFKFRPKYSQDRFNEDQKLTIGVSFYLARYQLGNYEAKVQFWDIAPQDSFKFVRPTFYRRKHGVVIVASISNESDCQQIENHIREITNNLRNIPILIFDTGDAPILFNKLHFDGVTLLKYKITQDSQEFIEEKIKDSIKILGRSPRAFQAQEENRIKIATQSRYDSLKLLELDDNPPRILSRNFDKIFKCANCEKNFYKNKPKFCTECGKDKISEVRTVVLCKTCEIVLEREKFCPNCGSKTE
ncbi:MAG: hypothetical protein ACTSYI_08665 [Promethearchaeota archaeon]